jgi:RNA polymerase sigma-70 factor, ECF subfamily
MEPLQSLVEKSREGDRDAFAEIVRRLSRQAVATAHLITGDLQIGEDAAQEAFLTTFRKLRSLKEAGAFRSWFGVILTRIACRARVKFIAPLPEEIPVTDPPRDTLPDIALGLKPMYREVLALRYVEDLSYQEIAEALGLSVARVKSRLHDARRLLRDRYVRRRGGS